MRLEIRSELQVLLRCINTVYSVNFVCFLSMFCSQNRGIIVHFPPLFGRILTTTSCARSACPQVLSKARCGDLRKSLKPEMRCGDLRQRLLNMSLMAVTVTPIIFNMYSGWCLEIVLLRMRFLSLTLVLFFFIHKSLTQQQLSAPIPKSHHSANTRQLKRIHS